MSWQEALSNLNPFDFTGAARSSTVEQAVVYCTDHAGSTPAAPTTFELDPAAFMTAIEDPRPLFLQDCESAIRELLRSSGEAA